MTTRVVIAEMPANAERDLAIERAILGPDVQLVRHACDGDIQQLVAVCRDAEVILTDFAPLTREVLERLPRCRLISVAATGYNGVDVQAAVDENISVCAIDEYCTDEVADHVILLALALCRRLVEYHEQVQQHHRWQFDSLEGLSCLRHRTLGIVGFGRIGQAVARRARGFETAIIAHDPNPDIATAERLGVHIVDFETLLGDADIVSLNCAMTADNRHLIDAKAFRQMRRKPFLINCARGGLVDEEALVEALDSGRISGAGLDVLDDEAPDLRASGLTGRSNVILTPHVAFYSDASILENRRRSASNIRHFLDGRHDLVRRYIHRATDLGDNDDERNGHIR